ncbi:MAG: prenyltransferase/squalene oxidase repeat-containing protein [Candidatus Helarchaeota archaeon]
MLIQGSKNEWLPILPRLKLGAYLLKRQRIDGSFGSLEETYWAITALAHLDLLDSIDKDGLVKYIMTCKRINGFAPSPHDSEIDLYSIFYAISSLFLIGKQSLLSIEEFETIYKNIFNFQRKSGGFAHCNLDFCPICKAKPSHKSTFYAIFSIKLLYEISPTDDKKMMKGYLAKPMPKKDIQQVFHFLSLLLLNHVEDIDEDSISNLINLQRPDGSFSSLEYTFWVVYCLDRLKRLRNINKGKVFEYIRGCQREDKSFSDEKDSIRPEQLSIKETAFAYLSLSMIWNELVDYIENKLFIQLYTNEKILLEEFAEECFVRSDLIIYIVKQLMKYEWFNVEIRDSIDFIKEYIRKFDAISKRIAVDILKYIAHQDFVNLSELASNYSATDYSKGLERVVAVANQLLEKKFIIGEVKWNKRFFRVTGFLHGVLPGKVLVKLNQIPYHEVTIEKEQIPVEKKRIEDVIERIKPLTEKIKAEIDNLLDINEVDLAKEHLKEDITSALEILNNSNRTIQTNLSKFQYLNGDYSQFLMKDWVEIYQKTRESILTIEKLYLKKIQKKERIVQILKELEDFQEFVQEQLNRITEDLNFTIKLFQTACEEKTLEFKKAEIRENLNAISLSVERITPQLRTQAANLSKASIELRRSQETSQMDALEPLEKWLESMWMKKRKNTIKIISDIKAQLNAREDLEDNINTRRKIFNSKLRELSILIDSKLDSTQFLTATTTLNEKTEAILKFLSESNQFILAFIQDTASYLEGFQLTVEDLYDDWSRLILENMRNELISVKSDLEAKILSERELNKNTQLNKLIEKNISELKEYIVAMENELLNILEEGKLSTVMTEIKHKNTEIEDLLKSCNKQIQNFIKKTSQEFQNFPDTSQVTIHKWTLFMESFRRNLNLTSYKIINKLLVKMIFAVAPMFRGGRIQLNYLASKLNMKKNEIEDRIIHLISIAKLEGQYDKDKEEIIPLTDELKLLLKFEESIKEEMDSLKLDYDRTIRLFETSCRKRQLDEKVTEEIIDRTRNILSRKYKTEMNINQQIKNLPQHIDLQILVDKWLIQKLNVEQNLALIKTKIDKRRQFKEKITQYIQKVSAKINDMATPIETKINSGQYLEADKILSKQMGYIEPDLKKYNHDLKLIVEKTSNELARFDLVVADLLTHWSHEKTRLKTDLSDTISRLKEKINEGLVKEYKLELKELIRNSSLILKNFINTYEKNIEDILQKGELRTPLTNLADFHRKFTKEMKNCQLYLNRFINEKSKSLKIFKDTIDSLMTRWNFSKQELQKTFQETYLQLENQLLIKYLQDKQIAYTTSRLSLTTIFNDLKRLKLKRSELRQRLTSLIAAEKLSGRFDPNSDEYIFPSSRIEEAHLERPPESLLNNETPSTPLHPDLWARTVGIFKEWYPVMGSLGGLTTLSVTLYSLTGNLLAAILIPCTVLPAIFIYVIYSHYRKQKKMT